MRLKEIKYLVLLLIAYNVCGQSVLAPKLNPSSDNTNPKFNSSDLNPLINNNIASRNSQQDLFDPYRLLYINITRNPDNNINPQPFDHTYYIKPTVKKVEKITTQIISSYRENIRFVGFWNGYAIINFSPSVNIQPFDFISVNANQNLSCFVNIHELKQNFRPLFIHGAAILVIDNSFKFLFGSGKMLPTVINFTAKNLIIALLDRTIASVDRNRMFGYNSYNYSVSIRF